MPQGSPGSPAPGRLRAARLPEDGDRDGDEDRDEDGDEDDSTHQVMREPWATGITDKYLFCKQISQLLLGDYTVALARY
ncbi:hypothetical protein HGM15179_008211 [Zosterops borbonicus]|uniref:Uncharacterized protein n=1 Tax=Zosterops borbonicus TaxID=364589 RepID=A0A8K1GJ89_9PASS|nr:hypothetical protein HGM15179_008211 [Zosterops borbonicus]